MGNLFHRFYSRYHDEKLDCQGAFSSSAVVTCFRTFAAMNTTEESVITSCVDCGVVADPGVECVTHSGVSDCQLEILVTARHSLPSATIITMTCYCIWSENIITQEIYCRTYNKPMFYNGNQIKHFQSITNKIVCSNIENGTTYCAT